MVVPFAAGGAVDVLGRIDRRARRGNPRPADRDRERRRRRRHDRRQPRRQGRARRLPVRARQRRHPRAEPVALQAAGLRRREGLRAGHPGRLDAALLVDAQGFSGQQPAGVHRLRQGPSRRAEYGSAGAGSAIHLGCVLFNAAAGIERDAHSLSRRRAGHAGHDRRPDRLWLQHHHQRLPAGARPARQGAGPARRQARARCCPILPPRRSRAWPDFDAGSWNIILPAQGHAGSRSSASSTPP